MSKFVAGQVEFDEALDFTRGSEATYIGPDGLIQTAAVDEPRFTHDPETGEALGLLIEEQRTNLVPYSESPSNWATVEADILPRVGGGTIVSSGILTTAARRGLSDVSSVASATPNTQHTKTIIVENISAGIMWVGAHWGFNNFARQAGLAMDFTDMSVKYVGPKVLSYKVEPVGGEKYSITITSDLLDYTNTIGLYFLSGVPGIYLDLDSVLGIVTDVEREFVFYRAQREIGSTPSSYIPTNGSQVTRAADVVSRTLGTEYSAAEGSLAVTSTVPTGETVIALGAESIVSDSDTEKTYTLSYNADPSATALSIAPGASVATIKRIEYIPRA